MPLDANGAETRLRFCDAGARERVRPDRIVTLHSSDQASSSGALELNDVRAAPLIKCLDSG